MTDLLWVGDRGTVASDSHTVGLWELDEDEILVSKACEYEQDATVSAVSVLNPGTRAVKAGDLADGTEFTPARSGHATCVAPPPYKDSVSSLQ